MKHSKRRILSGVLAAGMLITSVPDAFAADDLTGHWAQSTMQQFINKNYLFGYGNDIYKPDQPMTRAEFAALINRVAKFSEQSESISLYSDVALNSWYRDDLAKALAAGFMSGTSSTTLSPTSDVTREQGMVMISRLLKLEDGSVSALESFPDRSDITSWAEAAIAAMVQNGYVKGRTDGKLVPKKELTRAEGVTMLSNVLNQLEGMGNISSDDSPSGGSGGSSPEYAYVMMNIPYESFYNAEVSGNTTDVDAVSSATKSKPANTGLVGGSYHKSDNTEITGVTYPVYVDRAALRSLTQVSSADDLFTGASYSYFLLSETPSNYKEASVASNGNLVFSAIKGGTASAVTKDASLAASSNYGDYQLTLDWQDAATDLGNVYGVVLHTEEGEDYALRHLENIWQRTNLAWSTGFTTTAHGNTLASNHYISMMGQTLTGATYYTENGIKEVTFTNTLYVPKKFANTFTVANALASSGFAALTMTGFPSDYEPEYTLSGPGTVTVNIASGHLTWAGTPAIGTYTLKVSDQGSKYADYSASFEMQTDAMPAAHSSNADLKLTTADGASAADLSAYLQAISSVTIDGKSYPASGRDAASIITDTGWIDLSTAPFADMEAGKQYQMSVIATGYQTPLSFTLTIPEKIYGYAKVPYADYWENENVALSEDADNNYAASSSVLDSNGEADKGAYDAVTRATFNHGWHRGSFQQDSVIHTDKGDLHISNWTDATHVVLSNGVTATWDSAAKTLTYTSGRNTVTAAVETYQNFGIKYVPVAVPAGDFQAFHDAYVMTQNGATMAGGYTEGTLTDYTDLVAAVDANTNGLKAVTKTNDGWSFGARSTGTGSGITGAALATTADVTAAVVNASKFGDFIRVDLTGAGYGALGSRMQTVVWKYYSDGNTVLATYGTKFAADDWMHKSMGIQLGLTDSMRCKLPEKTTGVGKWEITVYALGYTDTTFTVNVTADDIHGVASPMTDAQRTTLEGYRDQAALLLENYNAATATEAVKTLKAHYDETVSLLANENATYAGATELIGELPTLLSAALTSQLRGTYQQLFDGMTFQSEYNKHWTDYCAAIVGADSASDYVNTMKSSVNAEKYGTEAAENQQSFYCGFTQGLVNLTIKPSANNSSVTISGTDSEGDLFSHEYTYQSYQAASDYPGFYFYIFETADTDANEFKYFAFCADSPVTTYHIEFRYGSDLDDLLKALSGPYAFWQAAGIQTNADADTIEKVIALFCLENMDYSAKRSMDSLHQIADFVGTWDYYVNGASEPDTLYFTVDEDGEGNTYYRGANSATYNVYAYDNDGSADTKSGIYVSVNDGVPTAAKYAITTSAEGTFLTLTGEDDGEDYTLTYMKRAGAVPPTLTTKTETATVEGFGYQANVRVTYDADGVITAVADNGTEPGSNSMFWNNAVALFQSLIGKTKGEVDAVDAISGATYSSNAIKKAVKSALSD